MPNADINKKEFVVIAELTEDCQFLQINHHKNLARVIKHLVGQKLEVGFKLFKYKRSDGQNRWLWGIAYTTIVAWWKESFGEKLEKDTLHAYSKQVVLGGENNQSVAFSRPEFLMLMLEAHKMGTTHSEEDFDKIITKMLPSWLVNVKIQEVLGKRIVVDVVDVSTASMNTQQFCDFKDALQAHFAEKGCIIANPKENNLLSDFIDE